MTLYQRIVVIFVGVLLLFSIGMSIHSITKTKPVMADFNELPVIVIDAGHGGADGGATANGVVEKDVNLAICLVMRDLFESNGFTVIMTRDTDISIHDEGVTTLRKQKTSDLRNRLAIVNTHPNAIFLSIHQNKFGQSSSHGAQIFYSPNNPQSESLAGILQDDFVAMLEPENHRKYKRADKNLYLMHEANCTAVLAECGFLSNAADAKKLSDPEYQSRVAFTIFCSVMRFLGLGEPAI